MTDLVTVIGAGQMGLVLSDALLARGVSVRLWGPRPETILRLADAREAPRRLPGFRLPAGIEVTTDADHALDGTTLVLNAIPTQHIRSTWVRLRDRIPESAALVCVSKGVENDTLLRPSEVIAASLGRTEEDLAVCALSGPTIAAELARHLPATMVAASSDGPCAARVQDLFRVPWLRVYRHDDLVGVEIAGATKNVIALAAGMVDGLGAGDNAKSALLSRGLAEIARLGVALGARVDTFFGVAGVGDLATTCFSPFGRNRICGERLGKGETLDEILATTASVVEGVPTTRSIVALASREGVDMPITRAVHAILFDGLAPRDAIERLMSREPKAEHIG